MPTLAEFAIRLGQEPVLRRAISFTPNIDVALLTCPTNWSLRLRSSAGYFHSSPFQITLHPDLQRQGHQALVETLLHEVAHAMQWLRYKLVDHGETWQEAMYQLGQKPQRMHSMRLKAATRQSAKSIEELGL